MDIKIIQNAIIIKIDVNDTQYNFFLDSGFPHSFSKDLIQITNLDLKIENEFILNLYKPTTDTSDLEKILGINISGFLGLDFIQKFENFSINLNENKVDFQPLIEYDFSLPILNLNPIITNVSIENHNKSGLALFDTGSFQSMLFNLNDLDNIYKSSKGWVFPSTFGQMLIDYYADIPVFLETNNLGNFTFGFSSDLPQMPFKYVLGLNFMCEFIVNLNFSNNTIELKRNTNLNDKIFHLNFDTNSIGIQLIYKDNEFVITNILKGFENENLQINDKIIFLDGFDKNSFYNSISSNIIIRDINVLINNKKIRLQTQPIFK
jgi:hypothetical protein